MYIQVECIEILCQVRDLEAELDLEQRRSRDSAAENKKLQKQLADLRMQAEDDHRTVAELNDQVTTLQMKIVTMKRQLDENVRSQHSPLTTYIRTPQYSHVRRSVIGLEARSVSSWLC